MTKDFRSSQSSFISPFHHMASAVFCFPCAGLWRRPQINPDGCTADHSVTGRESGKHPDTLGVAECAQVRAAWSARGRRAVHWAEALASNPYNCGAISAETEAVAGRRPSTGDRPFPSGLPAVHPPGIRPDRVIPCWSGTRGAFLPATARTRAESSANAADADGWPPRTPALPVGRAEV